MQQRKNKLDFSLKEMPGLPRAFSFVSIQKFGNFHEFMSRLFVAVMQALAESDCTTGRVYMLKLNKLGVNWVRQNIKKIS